MKKDTVASWRQNYTSKHITCSYIIYMHTHTGIFSLLQMTKQFLTNKTFQLMGPTWKNDNHFGKGEVDGSPHDLPTCEK